MRPRRSGADRGASEATASQDDSPKLFLVKTKGHLGLLSIEDIDWLKAEGNYTRIHAGRAEHLVRRGIGVMESELPAGSFLRINRSVIVNVDRIGRLVPWDGGGYVVRLESGEQFKLTRRFARKLFHRFGRPL